MKISISSRFIDGPYGGGNSFVRNFAEQLKNNGHHVVFDLKDKDIDIAFLINPLNSSEFSTFNNFDIDYYRAFKNKNLISVQRINECDQRKNTNHINDKLIRFNENIDFNFFVSNWIKTIFSNTPLVDKPHSIILGGPDKKVFNMNQKKPWNHKDKIKIVTHHWSTNINKGYEIYQWLDSIIASDYWNKRIEFTFIGNRPEYFKFKNTKFLEPLSGNELAIELKKHHIYITASRNEPSGNHHMEAALSGLPILYINSGALPEYCNNFGEVFEKDTFENSLSKIMLNYDSIFEKLINYPYDFINVYNQILLDLINLYENKENLSSQRKNPDRVSVIVKYIYSRSFRLLLKNKNKIKRAFGYYKRRIFK